MKVKVEASWCIASGSCVLAAPKVFDQDENGVVVLIEGSPGPELQESVRTAASVCPSAVITIQED